MFTVINILQIFLFIIAGIFYLGGQGWLLGGLLLHKSLIKRKSDTLLLGELPFLLICGMIINYFILLLFQHLVISLIISGLLAVIGLCTYTLYFFTISGKKRYLPTAGQLTGILLICFIFLGPILTEPLHEWDARTIWFFHAKMIFEAETIGQEAGWQHPSVQVTHTDYPKLVPAMSAQIAYIWGFWNEYLPKLSLFFLLFPATLWLFSFSKYSWSFIVLILFFPFGFYRWMWNGYMDGYFAVYFSLSLLLMRRGLKSFNQADILSCFSLLLVLACIKNEGVLAILCGIAALLPLLMIQYKTKLYDIGKSLWKNRYLYGSAILISLFPLMLWSIYKWQWGLESDLHIFSWGAVDRLTNRIQEGAYTTILQHLYHELKRPAMLLGLLFFATLGKKKHLFPGDILPLIAGGLYFLGVFFVYVITPQDLEWHLAYSVDRTMLPVIGCIYLFCYFCTEKFNPANDY